MGFRYNARHDTNHKTNSRIGKETANPARYTEHHVKPKCPDDKPRTIIVDVRHHRAYHLLFGNAKNFEDACFILKRDWFPD